MKERIDYAAVSPTGLSAMRALDVHLKRSSLGGTLLELVKVRASQLNGCAYCIDMHTQVARSNGENEQRLYALTAWRETPFFDERERAALAWTEALTQIQHGIPDDVYSAVRLQFDEAQLVDLTYAVVAINGWNRVAIAFCKLPGTYVAPSLPSGGAGPTQPRT
jgi:AhpD family alkylhydroperoxidase